MLVAKEEQDFISNSSAENYRALLAQISKLVTDSAEKAADQQLREIKKFRRKEPKSFKRKGNEIQYKFNVEEIFVAADIVIPLSISVQANGLKRDLFWI